MTNETKTRNLLKWQVLFDVEGVTVTGVIEADDLYVSDGVLVFEIEGQPVKILKYWDEVTRICPECGELIKDPTATSYCVTCCRIHGQS